MASAQPASSPQTYSLGLAFNSVMELLYIQPSLENKPTQSHFWNHVLSDWVGLLLHVTQPTDQ